MKLSGLSWKMIWGFQDAALNCIFSFLRTVGPLFVKKEMVNWEEIKKEVGVVNHGGQYSPKDCTPKFKVFQRSNS